MAGELAHTTTISDALVILGAAGIVIPVFHRFRITPVIGFILIGILVGPSGLGRLVPEHPWLFHVTISEPEALEPFAQFGIVLLLFTIGLELSFNRLWSLRRLVFGLGALEVIISAGLLAAVLAFVGEGWTAALALGFALALSSTAIVLPISGTTSPVGRSALAMLLFEDIMIVPIIFVLGALAPHAQADGWDGIFRTLWQGLVVVAALLVAGRLALPRLFAQAARTKSPELFLAASLLVVIGASLATSAVGLSPIVGALIAGLLIAETEFQAEVEGIIEPFKGLALGIFLITIGMSIDLSAVWDELPLIALAVAGVLSLKAIVTGALLRLMGARHGTAAETGLLMASPSETTLIVLAAAMAALVVDEESAQFWQIVTAIGLTITPVLARIGQTIGRRLDPLPALDQDDEGEPKVIIIGAGRVGQLVADMLTNHGKAYVAIDSDADMVDRARRQGYRAVFGDAGRGQTLERLGIERTPALVLTMDQPVLAQRLTAKLRKEFPELPIIARARDLTHATALYLAGASHAVPETLESSLQLSEAVLVDIGVPMGPVIASIHEKRDEFREHIRREADLHHTPKLRTGAFNRG